jgi:hypothetical protein
MITIKILPITVVFSLILFSCEKKISQYNSKESHYAGQDCMQCHKSGGDGEGHFKVAGTVYDSTKINVYPKATIKLYSAPQGGGNLIKTIEVDGNGNFYSTEKVKFKKDVYPTVEGINGGVKFMSTPISNGNCNSCHGVTTNKIWVK